MRSEQLSLSVIIPVFDGEEFLAAAVASVRQQDSTPLEIIVVDDGSTDNTARIARGLGSEVRYLYQANAGPPAARNRGLALARGEFIGFLDADDLWSPGRQAPLLAPLMADARLEVVLGHTQFIRRSRSGEPGTFEAFSGPFLTLSLSCGLFRRSVFGRVGGFNEHLRHSDDTDWFLRAHELGARMVTVPGVTQFYRRHERNITNQQGVDQRYMLKALKLSLDRRRLGRAPAAPLPDWFTAADPAST